MRKDPASAPAAKRPREGAALPPTAKRPREDPDSESWSGMVVNFCTFQNEESGEMESRKRIVTQIENYMNDKYGKSMKLPIGMILKFYPHFPGCVVRLESSPASGDNPPKIFEETIIFPEATIWGEFNTTFVIKAECLRDFIVRTVRSIRAAQ